MSTGTNIERITENNGIINDNNADLVALKNRIDNLPDTSTATATASDILEGKTAFVNGQKITGTIPNKPYIEVEYIAIANGNPYIDTNFIHTANTKVEIKFFASSTNLTNFVGLMGARQVNKNYYAYVFFTRFNNSLRFAYCRTGNEIAVDGLYDKEITLITYRNSATFTDGTTINTITSTGTINQGTNNFLLFNINTGGQNAVVLDSTNVSGTRIYYCKIWSDNGETLVRDFIPVIRKSTGKACLYDKVTETFFENQGTGDFVAGSIIE